MRENDQADIVKQLRRRAAVRLNIHPRRLKYITDDSEANIERIEAYKEKARDIPQTDINVLSEYIILKVLRDANNAVFAVLVEESGHTSIFEV